MLQTRSQRAFVTLLCALLLRYVPVYAQQRPPDPADFVQPGEHIALIEPALRYEGHLYQVYYFTSGDYQSRRASLLYVARPGYFQENGINGLLMTRDGNPVTDDNELIQIITLYRAAAELYDYQSAAALGYIDDSFVDDLRAVTRNPFFVEQQIKNLLFGKRTDQTAEALRGIITSQLKTPATIQTFSDEIRQGAEKGNTVVTMVQQLLEAARFSNNRQVRLIAKDTQQVFKSWRPVTQQAQSFVEVGGERIELFNALDVLSMSMKLIWLADLQRERAEWLNSYVGFASGDGALDAEQIQAVTTVTVEAENNWIQRADIVLQFVKDHAADLVIKRGAELIADKWVDWSWSKFGKRTTGHLIGGAASAVLIGFTIGNLIYGLDDLFDNFKAGERADELRLRFHGMRLQMQQPIAPRTVTEYDGNLAAQFRVVYMLESLSSSYMLRAYADGVLATVGNEEWLTSFFRPISWFKGKEWREAVRQMREVADQIETRAEDDMGHPEVIDEVVQLVHERLNLSPAPVPSIVDDNDPRFSTSGNLAYWQALPEGFEGSAKWTYNEINTVANSARWTPTLPRAGIYQVEAYVPAHSAKLPKPYTASARYTIRHAGVDDNNTISQAGTTGGWLDLGTYYFDTQSDEYVQLVDQTGEPAGRSIVLFDAMRWSFVNSPNTVFDSAQEKGLVYDVVLPGETADLEFKVRNAGLTPWRSTNVQFIALPANPPGVPASLSLPGDIPVGGVATWTVTVPISGAPRVEHVSYRMQHDGSAFGPTINAYVFVLPPQLKNLEVQIRQQIEEWQRQGEQAIDQLVQRIWEEIQHEMERQAQGFIDNLCGGSGFILSMLLLVGYVLRRRTLL